LDEIRFYPKVVGVRILLIPESFNTEKIRESNTIKDAHGTVILKLYEANIELPFLIKDGEFMPFDFIQMKGQRAPYSRENLAKVLLSIDRIHNDPGAMNPDSPFEKLDEPVTEITDAGFLGNTLRIQEQAINPSRDRGEIMVRSEELDNLLEKTASIKAVTEQDLSGLEKFLTEKFAKEFIDEMEKIAAEDTTDMENTIALVFENLKNLPFTDINTLPNGTKFVFPEKTGTDVNLVKAVLFKEPVKPQYNNRNGSTREMGLIPDTAIVVTEDGRFMILKNRAKFYGIKQDGDWKIPTKHVADMKEGKIYCSVIGNKIVFPFVVHEDISERFDEGFPPGSEAGLAGIFNFGCSLYPDGDAFDISRIPNKRFEYMKRNDASEFYGTQYSPELAMRIAHMMPYSFFACDEDTPVIELKGLIQDYLVDPKELVFTKSEDEIFKSAAAQGTVILKAVDRERDLYDLKVEFRNDDKKFVKMDKKEFKAIDAGKVKGILKAAGLEYSVIITLLNRSKGESIVSIPLPENATPEKINGGYVESKVKTALNTVKNNVYAKDNVDAAVSEILGRQIGNLAVSHGADAMNFLMKLQSFASESEALSVKFEKLAQEYHNNDFLDIAKLMTIQHNIDNANIRAYNGEKLAFVNDCMKDIVALKPELEKAASDLIALKTVQFEKRNEFVSPNIITAAVNTLDRMYKIARGCGIPCPPDGNEKQGKKVDLQAEAEKTENKETAQSKATEQPEAKVAESVADELGIVKPSDRLNSLVSKKPEEWTSDDEREANNLPDEQRLSLAQKTAYDGILTDLSMDKNPSIQTAAKASLQS
jgi:hypothetical protein